MSIPTRDILTLANQFRSDVLAQEDDAVGQVVDAYQLILDALEDDLDDLLDIVRDRRAAGEAITQAWLQRQGRLQTLIQQVEEQVNIVAANMEGIITGRQRSLVSIGEQHAQQLIMAGFGSAPAGVSLTFNRFNPLAVQQMVGFLADGSPLRDLLAELGPDAASQVRTALLRGIGTGQHPRTVARLAREALDGNLARAERISRTEMLRAYRQSTHETYRANRDVLEGWVWTAALDSRTCMSCLVMHGTLHQVDEIFGSHPQCRCAMVPRTKSWEDLGFDNVADTRPTIEPGRHWFERQDEFTKRRMLGKSKYAAYKDGSLGLDELVGFRNDPKWGPQRWERSLRSIVGTRQAREYYQVAADD